MSISNCLILRQPPHDNCGICLDPLDNGEPVLTHDANNQLHADGSLHPLHKRCWQNWGPQCPNCTAPVNFSSAMTWAERLGAVSKKFLSCSLMGAVSAASIVAGAAVAEPFDRGLDRAYPEIPLISLMGALSGVTAAEEGIASTGSIVAGTAALFYLGYVTKVIAPNFRLAGGVVAAQLLGGLAGAAVQKVADAVHERLLREPMKKMSSRNMAVTYGTALVAFGVGLSPLSAVLLTSAASGIAGVLE